MSTKIYEGRRVHKSEFWSFIHAVQHELTVLAFKLERSKIAQIAVEAIDDMTVGRSVQWRSGTPWWHACEELLAHAKEIRRTSRRDPAYDFSYVLCMHEFDEYVFIFPIVEQEAMMKVVNKYSEDYGYWNNADRPKAGISEKRWKLRGKEWDVALQNPQITLRRDSMVAPDHRKVKPLPKLPSFEKRVQRLAIDAVCADAFPQTPEDDSHAGLLMTEVMDLVGSLNTQGQWKGGSDHLLQFAKHKRRIEKLLKPAIAIPDMLLDLESLGYQINSD